MFRKMAIVRSWLPILACMLSLSPLIANAGTATNGTLYFDTFQRADLLSSTVVANATVQSVHFNYNGGSTAGSFGLSSQTLIKDLGASGNADGLIFGPNGNLLIGGSTTGTIIQMTTGGTIVGSVPINPSGTNPYHLSLSPDGSTIYSGGETGFLTGGDTPGPLGVTPFFSPGTAHAVTGSDTGITQIAFDPSGNSYYTSSTFGGTGNFGTINLSTFITTSKITSLPAAHGITYDPFTHDLIVAGAGHITQIDPTTFSVISDLDITSQVNTPLDQVTVDGLGHVFASSNGAVNIDGTVSTTGQLVFIDMSGGSHTLRDASNFMSINNLADALDDIAPLSGPGSIPEPGGIAVVALALLSVVRRRTV